MFDPVSGKSMRVEVKCTSEKKSETHLSANEIMVADRYRQRNFESDLYGLFVVKYSTHHSDVGITSVTLIESPNFTQILDLETKIPRMNTFTVKALQAIGRVKEFMGY
jgi:hypothetical protein